jgi:hypothetical protein
VPRVRRWLGSDLIGIPVTVGAAGLLGLTIGAFFVAGPVAGIVFAIPVVVLVYFFAFRRQPSDLAGIRTGPDGHRHRVLVVANDGLEHPGLIDELIRRGEPAETEVMIVAPVVATTPSHAIADDIDSEARGAEARVEETVKRIEERGVPARGHVDDEGDPMQALVDGLREFAASEVVMVPGAERGWPEAEQLAGRIRREVGVPVTELGPPRPVGTGTQEVG